MKRKIYGKYNKISKQIELITLMSNDEEAQLSFAIANDKAKEQNKYYDENNYQIIALGVLEMEGEEAGIKYEYKNDFPYKLDNIPYGFKNFHNQESTKDTTVKDEKRIKEIREESRV